MAVGDLVDFVAVYTADAANLEAVDEPLAARHPGAAGFYATAPWLRTAFADLAWEVHDVVQDGSVVVAHATMSGRQTGPFTTFDRNAAVDMVFPPTGRQFAVTRTHWFRVVDGKVAEHWANRDDLGMGQQLGWTPPKPIYLARMHAKGESQDSIANASG